MAEEEEKEKEAARLTADHAFVTNASLTVFIPSKLHVLTDHTFSPDTLNRAETFGESRNKVEEENEKEEEVAFTGSSGVFADLGSFSLGALHGGLGEGSSKSSGSPIHLPTMEQKTNYLSLSDTGSFSEFDSTGTAGIMEAGGSSIKRKKHRRKFKTASESRPHNRKAIRLGSKSSSRGRAIGGADIIGQGIRPAY
jgi:hypothetical protein